MDQRVEIHATSRADINGKRGVATDFHPMDRADYTTWRYTVQLDSGEAFKVKRANVRAADVAGKIDAALAKLKKSETTSQCTWFSLVRERYNHMKRMSEDVRPLQYLLLHHLRRLGRTS